MRLVYSQRGGLTVAEYGADHASVQKALREHDDDLRLLPQPDDVHAGIAWTVLKYMGPDRPAVVVCSWRNERMEPLPLSHALVDHVKTLDPRVRGHAFYEDPDVANAKLLDRRRRDLDADMDEFVSETARRAGRHPVLHRGVHLRRSRHRRDGRVA